MKKFYLLLLVITSTTLVNATSIKDKFSYQVGGFVNVRVAYQFEGIVNDLDMVTYNIPVPGSYDTKSELNFDCSISRLFFKSTYQSSSMGPIVGYIETDFRGDNTTLSLRQCYITIQDFLVGQTFTNFCDLEASPITIDFEGPNSYNAEFNLMVRYQNTINKHWKLSASLEMPQISMSSYDNLKQTTQILPDFTIYGNYSWAESHLRASAVIRDLRYYNSIQDKNKDKMGWGLQLSGKIDITKRFMTYFQSVYGQGITPYIQDLTDSGLDLVINPKDENELQMLPSFGFFWSFQYDFSQKWFCSLGYGMVRLYSKNDYQYSYPDTYKFAQYFFANAFYNLTPSCQIALEYLMGSRENMNKASNSANRIQTMIQYNF